MEKKPLLAIYCTAYNHEPYIRECLDGFVMQKTTFPFIAIVHDDASTDKTAEIVREYAKEYPEIIKAIYETENQYSKHDGSIERIMYAATPESVKYIAFCEGDDYWFEPNKLQMQVDFLEKHPNYGMCYTKNKRWNQEKTRFDKTIYGKEFQGFDDLLLMGSSPIATLTVVIRKNMIVEYNNDINPATKKWLCADYPLWIYTSYKSKIKLLSDITSVYRVLPESASHSKDVDKRVMFKASDVDIQNFFIQKYTKYETIPFDFHREKLWAIINDRRFSRKDIINEFSLIEDVLTKKEKLFLFIAKNPVLFVLLRLKWKLNNIIIFRK